MKSIFIKTVLISLGSWLIFMSIDSMFLGVFTLAQKSYYNLFPDFISSLTILACYLCIGISLGLISVMILFIKNKTSQTKSFDGFYLPLSLSLTINCMINIYIINNELHLPFQMPITYGILFGLLLYGFMKITKYLKKSVMVSLFSLCVSLEMFWSIVRGFLKGGILFVIINDVNIVYIFLSALFIYFAVFMLLYFLVPNLLSKVKGPLLKLSLILMVLCLLLNDALNGHAHSDQMNISINRPNILLIVMDTMRVDHMSCFGYHKKTTPHIDKCAQDAFIYKKAYSTASWTLPSVASILTGTYPGYHGAHRAKTSKKHSPMNKLDEKKVTIAESLKQVGYNTAGIVSCTFLTKGFGLHQGFNYFDDRIPSYLFALSTFGALRFLNYFFPLIDYLSSKGYYGYKVATQINKSALSWIERNGKMTPFFLFLHYFDPHHPYLPEKLGTAKENVPDKIRKRYRRENANYVKMEHGIIYPVFWSKKPLLRDEKKYLIHNYDREIALLDEKIGEIFEKLKEMDIYDHTLIIITADHGESFGEHNLMLHGVSLYEDNIRVPLIIKYPFHDKQKEVIDHPVSLSGIVPTILSYLSIEIPDYIQGSPFISRNKQKIIAQNFRDPSWNQRERTKRFDQDLISLIVGDYKYIKSVGGEDKLFNIEGDPGETNNLIGGKALIAENIKKILEGYIKDLGLFEIKGETAEMNQSVMQNLKALGYIQ